MKIEKNIPIPPNGSGGKKRGMPPKYPLADMQIGDSFVVKKKTLPAVYHAAKRYGVKLTTRTEGRENIRVWKVGVVEPTPTGGENE